MPRFEWSARSWSVFSSALAAAEINETVAIYACAVTDFSRADAATRAGVMDLYTARSS